MVGIVVAVGFVGMVLAPCAVAIYSKLGNSAENAVNLAAELQAAQEQSSRNRRPVTATTSRTIIRRSTFRGRGCLPGAWPRPGYL